MATPVSSLSPLSSERQPVIIAARRTPVGRAGGSLAAIDPAPLAAAAMMAALADAGLPPAEIDDVIVGNAAGGGGNIARLAALTAGLPVDVPGVSVDRQCGSGLEAVMLAARLVTAGAGEAYLAGGVESVSRAPWRMEKPQSLLGLPRVYGRARFAPEQIGDPDMGVAAETVAEAYAVSRQRQDEFALESHRRAVAAMDAGRFAAEIVPVAGPQGEVAVDECPRRNTSADALAKLRPTFRDGGTVTAGNSCPLNDGAAMVVVTSRARARSLGISRMLAFVDGAAAGVDPNLLGIGPVASTRKLLRRQPGLSLRDVPVIEFNEAFAAQVLASVDQLGIDPQRINRDGGAIALGHPFGASGAILVTRLFSQLVRAPHPGATPGQRGLAMLGIGGGLGLTALFERLDEGA